MRSVSLSAESPMQAVAAAEWTSVEAVRLSGKLRTMRLQASQACTSADEDMKEAECLCRGHEHCVNGERPLSQTGSHLRRGRWLEEKQVQRWHDNGIGSIGMGSKQCCDHDRLQPWLWDKSAVSAQTRRALLLIKSIRVENDDMSRGRSRPRGGVCLLDRDVVHDQQQLELLNKMKRTTWIETLGCMGETSS